MQHLIFDTATGRCLGSVQGAAQGYNCAGVLVDAATIAQDVPLDDLRALLLHADGSVRYAQELVLEQTRAERIAVIKQEAAALLAATAWKVERAREREQAGFEQLADLAAVLAQREAVRRSSSAAEATVQGLGTLAEVQAFTWQPDAVQVPAPRLMTHEQFIQRFTVAEWDGLTGAARASVGMDAWMRRFSMASYVNLDDAATQAGVQALELAGLLGAGRAQEVLA